MSPKTWQPEHVFSKSVLPASTDGFVPGAADVSLSKICWRVMPEAG
jgi:hypothetical protein